MKPILSMCIPTYNRCGYLYFTLKSIVEKEIFQKTNDIEIVISDNCSTDHTEKIAKIFVDQFPDKIIYNKNETNIYDKNFEKVLALGNGEVLKLHNDNFLIYDGALEYIVNKINELRDEKTVLFFANGNALLQEDSMCNNMNEFVDAASFLSGWIGAFSIWKEDFEKLEDFGRNYSNFFIQTDVLLRMLANGKKVFVSNEKIFYGEGILKKGGCNIAKVFGQNYLSVFKPYLSSNLLDKKVYEKEKKRLLLKHVIPMQFYDSLKNKFSWFKNDSYVQPLIKDYWYNLYFYTSAFEIFRLVLNAGINLIGQKLNKNINQKYWRKRNKHNNTSINESVDITKVFVGANCKGYIDANFSENPNEILIIEDNVTIEEGVKFTFDSSDLIIVKNSTIQSKDFVCSSSEV